MFTDEKKHNTLFGCLNSWTISCIDANKSRLGITVNTSNSLFGNVENVKEKDPFLEVVPELCDISTRTCWYANIDVVHEGHSLCLCYCLANELLFIFGI